MPIIYTVPQSHCAVVERFGRFSRIQSQGLRFKIPLVETLHRVESWGEVANKNGYLIELTEQQTDTPPRQCHTKDNVPVTANVSVYWRITSPQKSIYEVDVLPQAVSDVALNALRSNVGMLDLDSVLAERAMLNDRIAAQLSETGVKWGLVFTRVEIQELTTEQAVAASMVKQMDAERTRRALIAEASGKAEAAVTVAEAEKRARVLRAEGEAEAIGAIAQAEAAYLGKLMEKVSAKEAAEILVAQKFLAGFEVISKGEGDKVFLPNSFAGLLSLPALSER